MTSTTSEAAVPLAARAEKEAHSGTIFLLVALTDMLVIALYVWLISVGTWVHWPGRWQVYDALATSFSHGQLALAERPDPALLALPDPYDPAARAGMPYPPDMSLFEGRFYAYFGPVPALLLVPIKLFSHGTIGDQYLVFLFVTGIFLIESIFVTGIRRRFFPTAARWTLLPIILALGLTNPAAWLLSTPTVYCAAIAGGAVFLLGGTLALYGALADGQRATGRLSVAGLLFALSLGSRVTQIVPIALLAALAVGILIRRARKSADGSRWLPGVVALLLPLAAGVALLAWYDWARFHSIFETGIRYQLAGIPLQQYSGRFYSPAYILQNLYNYLLQPPRLKYTFPYFYPLRGSSISVLPGLLLPAIYRAQEITGLLFNAPFLLLGCLPMLSALRRHQSSPEEPEARGGYRMLTALLAVGFLSGAAVFLAFFWAAERYLVDFLPGLVLLSVMGMWQIDQHLRDHPAGRRMFWVLLAVVLLLSILVSILLSMTFNADGFRQLNPVLWRQLSNLFRP